MIFLLSILTEEWKSNISRLSKNDILNLLRETFENFSVDGCTTY